MLEEFKIQDSDITSNGVQAAPDKLTGTAQQNKLIFDRLITNVVKGAINGLIDALEPLIEGKESASNKVTSMSAESTDTQYPSAKAVYESIAGAGVSNVSSVCGKVGAVTLDKTDVGMDNVDNTADLNKPISTAQKAEYAHENLLDNPFFTINQRGVSSWSSEGYTVDRWRAGNPGCAGSVNTNGITITSGTFYQMFEKERVPWGKTVTLSVQLQNGEIYSNTGTMPNGASSIGVEVGTFNIGSAVVKVWITQSAFVGAPLNASFSIINPSGADPIAIKAVKLEVGSISTLAKDTAPHYATELHKCQRYFYNSGVGAAGAYAFENIQAGQYLCAPVRFPVDMRAVPTVKIKSVVGTPNTVSEWWTSTDSVGQCGAHGLTLGIRGFNAISSANTFAANTKYSFHIEASADL